MTKLTTLDWKMTHTSKSRLRIDFKGKNPLSEVLYICDKIVVAKAVDDYTTTDAPIVMNYREPGQPPGIAHIILGPASSNRPSYRVFSPTYRRVEPGADFSGSVEVPFPLVSWNPLGGTNPMAPGITKVVFNLTYMIGEPPAWHTHPSKGGPAIKTPEPHERQGSFPLVPKVIPKK